MARSQTTRPRAGESLPRAADAEQKDLFGAVRPSRLRAAARATDPETSHTAARRAQRSISLKQLAVLDLFQRAERVDDEEQYVTLGLIDETMIHLYRRESLARPDWWPLQTDSGLRTRLSELVTLKHLRDSGQKHDTLAGSRSIAWCLTSEGRALDVIAFRITLENKAARYAQQRQKKRAGDLAP